MSTTRSLGRFALVLGALAAVFALLLLLASPAAAQHTGTGMIPTSGGGGLTTAAADLRYLKLAADNDPLTGVLTFTAGSAAAPALNFTGATTTGLYLDTAAIGFAHAGAQTWSMAAATLRGPAGAVGAPTYSFLLDPDTGIYNSTANTIDFTTTGVRRGYVNSDGITAAKTSGAGFIGFLASHSGSGTSQLVGFSANTNGSNYTEFYATGSTYTPSAPYPTNGGVITNTGAGGMNIASTHATTPVIRFMLDTPAVTIATIEATGIVPGSDASLHLGTSALSWDTLYAKTFADTAGTARFTALESAVTTITSTVTPTAGVDTALALNVTTEMAAADKAFVLSDNTGVSAAILFTIFGDGSLSPAGGLTIPTGARILLPANAGHTTAPTIYSTDADSGLTVTGTSLYFDANGNTIFSAGTAGVDVSQGGLSIASGAGLSISGTATTDTVSSSRFTNASAQTLKIYDNLPDITIYATADAPAETAVNIGTDNAVIEGVKLVSFCVDCDSALTEVGYVDDGGSLVMSGDGTFNGDDLTVGTVATIGASGIQTDGDLTVDGGDITLNAAAGATVKDTTNDALAVYSKAGAGEFGVILGSTETGTVTTELISVRDDVDGTPNTVFAVMGTGFIAPETYTATVTTASTLPSLLAPTMLLSCNNAGGADCAITLNETSAVAGMRQTFVNMNAAASGDTISFTSSAGVQSTPTGGVVLSQYDVIEFVYDGALWVMSSTSGNNVP